MTMTTHENVINSMTMTTHVNNQFNEMTTHVNDQFNDNDNSCK